MYRITGTREQLVRDLRGVAVGCLGSDAYRQQAADGAAKLTAGAQVVQVGQTLYAVTVSELP